MPRRLAVSSKRAEQESKSRNRSRQPQSAVIERAVTEQEVLSRTVLPASGTGRRVTRSLAKARSSNALGNVDTARYNFDRPESETPKSITHKTRTRNVRQSPNEKRSGAGSLRIIHKTQAPDRPQSDPNQSIRNWADGVEPDNLQDTGINLKAGSFWAQRGYDEPEPRTASYSSVMTDSSAAPSQSRRTSTRRAKSDRTEKGQETVVARDDKKFQAVLMEHNVNILSEVHQDVREADMKRTLFKKLSKDVGFAVDNTLTALEARWKRDMSKCMVSNEALFQRTIMMEILERHELDEKLDFTCEAPWRAERMPGRDNSRRLAQPKPDLAVGFNTISLLPVGATVTSISRLGSLRSHVCAEGTSKGELDRAFHFFSMEVKGKRGQISNSEAELQNLNTAAQGLYNIYVIMKEAGMESEYFRQVRFFSVVATTSGFEIRVHRGLRLLSDDYIQPDCGIRFGFDEILKIGSGYDKKTATTFVFNILLHYGVKILHPVLQKAMEAVLKKHPGISGLQPSAQQRSPSKGKRLRDDNLSESFESHASQRRRMEQLAVAG